MKHLTPYQLHKLDACSACGLCLPVCPTFAKTGLETASPRGRVALASGIAKGEIKPADTLQAFLTCTLCGKCAKVCPADIPLASIFFGIRKGLAGIPLTRAQRLWPALLTANQKAVDFLQAPLALAASLFPKSTSMPPLAQELFSYATPTEKADVLLFPGCLVRRFNPRLVDLSIRLLEKLGCSVILHPALVCCGRPLAVQGKSIARALRKNFALLQKMDFSILSSPCPGCLSMFREIIPNMAELSTEERQFAAELSAKCVDISTLALQKLPRDINPGPRSAHIWWHRPCLLDDGANYAEMQLLRLAGCHISMPSDSAQCCGAALNCVDLQKFHPPKEESTEPWHTPSKKYPLARMLPAEIRRQAQGSGAEAIVGACPACLLKITGASTPLDRLPMAHALEIWAQLLLEEPFPWRSGA